MTPHLLRQYLLTYDTDRLTRNERHQIIEYHATSHCIYLNQYQLAELAVSWWLPLSRQSFIHRLLLSIKAGYVTKFLVFVLQLSLVKRFFKLQVNLLHFQANKELLCTDNVIRLKQLHILLQSWCNNRLILAFVVLGQIPWDTFLLALCLQNRRTNSPPPISTWAGL